MSREGKSKLRKLNTEVDVDLKKYYELFVFVSPKTKEVQDFLIMGYSATRSIPSAWVNPAYIGINYDLLSIKGDHISVTCVMLDTTCLSIVLRESSLAGTMWESYLAKDSNPGPQ